MKSFALIIFVGAIIACAYAGEKKCTNGDVKLVEDDCQMCNCEKKKWNCATVPRCAIKTKPGPVSCTPGDSFYIECNKCFCTERGFAYCSKMGCDPWKTKEAKKKGYKNGFRQ